MSAMEISYLKGRPLQEGEREVYNEATPLPPRKVRSTESSLRINFKHKADKVVEDGEMMAPRRFVVLQMLSKTKNWLFFWGPPAKSQSIQLSGSLLDKGSPKAIDIRFADFNKDRVIDVAVTFSDGAVLVFEGECKDDTMASTAN